VRHAAILSGSFEPSSKEDAPVSLRLKRYREESFPKGRTTMKSHVAILCLLCGLALSAAGCPKSGTGPTPRPPQLVAMKVVGQQVCGQLTSQGLPYAFTCNGLPSTVPSGWQFTPVWVPSAADPTRKHLNRMAILTASGGSGTELDVEYVVNAGNPNTNRMLTPVAPPKEPNEVAIAKEVGVSASDDGTTRTWTVSVNVSPCADMRHIQLFDRAGTPPVRKGPLDVYFFRDPADEDCSGGGSYTGPGVYTLRTGPGDPTRDSPTGPCPGNAPRTLFNVCENCAFGHPQDANSWTGYEACSWQEVLDVFGYMGAGVTKPQICTIRQAPSREDCIGPP
jgi:hypothetical protein